MTLRTDMPHPSTDWDVSSCPTCST